MQRSYRHAWVGDERPRRRIRCKRDGIYNRNWDGIPYLCGLYAFKSVCPAGCVCGGLSEERNQYGAATTHVNSASKQGRFPDTVYITGEGTRFHISLACSGIKEA